MWISPMPAKIRQSFPNSMSGVPKCGPTSTIRSPSMRICPGTTRSGLTRRPAMIIFFSLSTVSTLARRRLFAKDCPQMSYRAQVAHSGGGRRKSQCLGRLRIAQLLEVSHEHDFRVLLFHLVQGRKKPSFQLFANGGGGGRQFVVAKLGRQVERGVLGKPRSQRLLAIDTPPLGLPMAAMRVDHMILGQLAEPQMKRDLRVAEIIAQPTARLPQYVLHDIAGVDPRSQRPIQPQLHHPP